VATSEFGTSLKCHGNFTMTAFGGEPDMYRTHSFFRMVPFPDVTNSLLDCHVDAYEHGRRKRWTCVERPFV
jgi:hypothetical protein